MTPAQFVSLFQYTLKLTSSQAAMMRTALESHFVSKEQVTAVVHTVCRDESCPCCHGTGEIVAMHPTTQIGSVYTCYGPHAAFGGVPLRYVYPEGFPKHLQYQPKPAIALNITVGPSVATATVSGDGQPPRYIGALDGQPFIVSCPAADTPLPSAQ